nr:uncharacterized protein LOC109184085 isoform X3 [Ipomoea batatas]
MVSSKSTTFVFCLVFISTSLNSSLAYTNQVTRKVVVEDENGFTMTSGSSLRHMEHKSIVVLWGIIAIKGKGKMMRMQRKLRIIRSTDSIKDNPGGFMAFNAGLSLWARPHPPKNER